VKAVLCSVAVLFCAAALSGVTARAADAPAPADSKAPATQEDAGADKDKPINTKCPSTGDDIDPKVTYEYEGKTIAFCCADCIDEFKKDPEKALKKIEVQEKAAQKERDAKKNNADK
jgi:YHS domain-containing protein